MATATMPPPRRASCQACGARVWWATTHANRRAIPLDPDPVPAGTRGALCLIGEVAFSLVDAVQRVRAMFDQDEPDAYQTVNEYPWHVAHFSTCPAAHKMRRGRRR